MLRWRAQVLPGRRGPAIAVVIPTLNDAETIGSVVASLPRGAVDRIIVADGGSVDGTMVRARCADDPDAIADIVAPIRAGNYDFVIGSRAGGKRESGSMASHQVLAGPIAGRLIRLLYGVRFTDMSAFRTIRRDILLALGMREPTYGWNLEMQMRLARAGLRVLELPVPYRCRFGGELKVAGSLRGTIVAGVRIVTTFTRITLEPTRKRATPGT